MRVMTINEMLTFKEFFMQTMKKIMVLMFSVSVLQMVAMQKPESEYITLENDVTFDCADGTSITYPKGKVFKFDYDLFFCAALKNDVSRLYQLIKFGYDINTVDDRGYTALGYAAKSGNIEAVDLLIRHGADVNYINKQWGGFSPLHECTSGRACRALIKAGAHVNALNWDKMTPLMCAGHFERHTVVQALLEAGAQLEIRQEDGLTALMMAASNTKINFMKMLIKAGANVHQTNDSLSEDRSGTPLIFAAGVGNYEGIIELIRAGADVNARNSAGMTALMKAAAYAKITISTDPKNIVYDAKTNSCVMGLIRAETKCNVVGDMVTLLIKAGAHTELKNAKGETALKLIEGMPCRKGHDALLEARERARRV